MVRRLKLFVLAILFGMPLAHAAKLYKWVDKDGNVSYHDQPPIQDGFRVEEKDINVRSSSTARIPQQVLDKFPVVLYSASKCSSCDSARAYLKSRGIPFNEKNVEGNRKLQDELIKQAGGLSVPTILIGGKVMRGYLESLLEGELDQAGYPKAGGEPRPETETQEQPTS